MPALHFNEVQKILAFKRSSGARCTRKRLRADSLEQVVLNHFASVAVKAGYFEGLEEKLTSLLKESPKKIEEAITHTKTQLKGLEAEVTATFRRVYIINGGSQDL